MTILRPIDGRGVAQRRLGAEVPELRQKFPLSDPPKKFALPPPPLNPSIILMVIVFYYVYNSVRLTLGVRSNSVDN